MLSSGAIVQLQNASTGKCLRIRGDGGFDGLGGNGKWTKFIVHRDNQNRVSFQSCETSSYIRTMPDGTTNGGGSGGKHCKYIIVNRNPHILQSIHGGHLGIKNDGSAKNAKNTGNGQHAQFQVIPVGHADTKTQTIIKQKGNTVKVITKTVPATNNVILTNNQQQTVYSNFPEVKLRHGLVVRLTSRNTGKNLRIRGDGELDANGGEGKWTSFIVHVDNQNHVSFQSQANPSRWVRTMPNGSTNGGGSGGLHTKYSVVSNNVNNPYIFRSVHNHGNLGVLPNGTAKAAQQTQMGKAAQFDITILGQAQIPQTVVKNIQMVSNIPQVTANNLNFAANLANSMANSLSLGQQPSVQVSVQTPMQTPQYTMQTPQYTMQTPQVQIQQQQQPVYQQQQQFQQQQPVYQQQQPQMQMNMGMGMPPFSVNGQPPAYPQQQQGFNQQQQGFNQQQQGFNQQQQGFNQPYQSYNMQMQQPQGNFSVNVNQGGGQGYCSKTGCKYFMKSHQGNTGFHDLSCRKVGCDLFMKHGCPQHSFEQVNQGNLPDYKFNK